MAVLLTKIVDGKPAISDTLGNQQTVKCPRCEQEYRLGYSDDEWHKLSTCGYRRGSANKLEITRGTTVTVRSRPPRGVARVLLSVNVIASVRARELSKVTGRSKRHGDKGEHEINTLGLEKWIGRCGRATRNGTMLRCWNCGGRRVGLIYDSYPIIRSMARRTLFVLTTSCFNSLWG